MAARRRNNTELLINAAQDTGVRRHSRARHRITRLPVIPPPTPGRRYHARRRRASARRSRALYNTIADKAPAIASLAYDDTSCWPAQRGYRYIL